MYLPKVSQKKKKSAEAEVQVSICASRTYSHNQCAVELPALVE